MRKKLKSRRGLTIAEMLVALIVMSLLTAGGVSATAAVMADYNRMQDAANAEILASTAIEAISNEIRLGKNIKVGVSEDSLDLEMSAFSDKEVTIKLDTDGRLVAVTTDAVTGDEISTKQILSEKTYSGLYLYDLKFEKKASAPGTTERTTYTFTFTVKGQYSDVLWSGKASAAPLME